MLISIILASVSALLIAVTVMVSYFGVNTQNTQSTSTTPDIIEGEGIYRGNAVAYPAIDSSTITRITINNKNEENINEFTFIKDSLAGGDFLFSYVENGEVKVFYPSIMGQSGISYSDFYAIETEDGYNAITRLNYLTASLQHTYFGYRIALSADPDERSAQLEDYGFGGDSETIVVFDYVDTATARPMTHKIIIGGKTVTGSGYYFMVDNRDYIYSSASKYFEYALLGFYSYVNTTLVAEGLDSDSTYEPILTSNFTHWKNTLHKDENADGVCDNNDCLICGSDPIKVKNNSTVIVNATTLIPISPADYAENPSVYSENTNGYEDLSFSKMEVNLHTGVEKNKIMKNLVDKSIGKYSEPLIYTSAVNYNGARSVDLSVYESVKYSYTILEIESVVTEAEDKTAPGTVISPSDEVRVAYTFLVNGKQTTKLVSHAVLDLNAGALPDGVAAEIASRGVGKLDTPITFDVVYTKENTIVTDYKTVVTEIVSIADKNGATMSAVDENTETVMYRYALLIDDEISGEEYLGQISFSSLESSEALAILNVFLGQTVADGLSLPIDEASFYGEVFRYFNTYVVDELEYFVTREQVVSFSYINYSDRDPFYGESIYQNNTEGYTLYGINNDFCDRVLRLIGGLAESSNQSVGLKGQKIESVGITPAKLDSYGCYMHTVYFELPRGVSVINSDNPDLPADYIAAQTLAFTLYISDVQDDGMRIVASDKYDVITRISNDYFFFLDKTFTGFWARENIIMTKVDTLKQITVELMMDDIRGSYQMNVAHDTAYRTLEGFQIGGIEPDEYIDSYDYITEDKASAV